MFLWCTNRWQLVQLLVLRGFASWKNPNTPAKTEIETQSTRKWVLFSSSNQHLRATRGTWFASSEPWCAASVSPPFSQLLIFLHPLCVLCADNATRKFVGPAAAATSIGNNNNGTRSSTLIPRSRALTLLPLHSHTKRRRRTNNSSFVLQYICAPGPVFLSQRL